MCSNGAKYYAHIRATHKDGLENHQTFGAPQKSVGFSVREMCGSVTLEWIRLKQMIEIAKLK